MEPERVRLRRSDSTKRVSGEPGAVHSKECYEREPVVLFGPRPEFMKISPLGKIPVYEDTIPISSVIIAYLERTHPHPPL
jgi:glutathione S-transferase